MSKTIQLSITLLYIFFYIILLLYLRWKCFFVRNITCCQANFHSSLPMSQNFKLRQGHFVGYTNWVWSLIPLIPDVSHRITNWGNHKYTPLTFRPVFKAGDPPITCRARVRQNIERDINILFFIHHIIIIMTLIVLPIINIVYNIDTCVH